MPGEYPGPLREEPIAVELHNTLYASRGRIVDGLAGDGRAAWLDAIAERLPEPARGAPVAGGALEDLRRHVRAVLASALAGVAPPPGSVAALNDAAERAPVSRRIEGEAAVAVHHGAAEDVLLAAFAADAIELVTGRRRVALRACGAPGCVLMFVKQHPRREWCSAACGNRARQARHYARTRERSRG